LSFIVVNEFFLRLFASLIMKTHSSYNCFKFSFFFNSMFDLCIDNNEVYIYNLLLLNCFFS